jgi:phosphatidylethanolamine/phosphatidyl-N-methylethanolamine N-methyltransferase
MSKKTFIKQFWKERKMVGAVRPSSRFLTEKMLENISFSDSKVIVELGPGTGVFTRKIIERMSDKTTLLVFELNEMFYEQLKKEFQDKRVILINDSAEKLAHYLKENHLENADAIISSLPLSNFSNELKIKVVRAIYKNLKQQGKYIQYQYSTQGKKLLSTFFKKIEISFTPLNIPPAFVYTCENK